MARDRAGRCLFSALIGVPCFRILAFVPSVHSQTFEGGLDAPRFLASGQLMGIRVDRVMSACGAGLGAGLYS